jgi:hypothetical protein
MGIIFRSVIVLALIAGSSGCAPKDPKPGDPRTSGSLPLGGEASTARCDDKSSGPSSGRYGSMPLMNRIA